MTRSIKNYLNRRTLNLLMFIGLMGISAPFFAWSDGQENGNTNANCDRYGACVWHQKENSFRLGPTGGKVRVTARPENVYEVIVTLESNDGNNIDFFSRDGGGFDSLEQTLPAGEYTIKPTYKWSDWDPPRNPHNLVVFVHWWQN